MNTKTEFKNGLCGQFKNLLAVQAGVLLLCLAVLVLALTVPARAETPSATIPFSDIGAKATADYHGDALSVTATADGARLHCGFQKLEGHANSQGLWLESAGPGSAGKLRLVATALRRGNNSIANSESQTILPSTGTIAIKDKLVHFTRPGVTEEYSVSVDGVRQDFIITERPAGTGELQVQLALNGARAEAAAYGVKLTLDGSGRALAYNHLRVQDATGRELKARLEVLSPDRLAVSVTDANAAYPIRIDPTFSDADWVSLNPGLPGVNGGVTAMAVDGSGNVYVSGGSFFGTVRANSIAKWDGSAWSALGSGLMLNSYPGAVYALAVSGTNLYAGGEFTTAGGVMVNNIAKWDGSTWSALGSGMDSDVYSLAVIGTNLYAGGYFTNAGGVLANQIAKWDGSTWSALGSGMNGSVFALAVSGANLYAGGYFTTAGGMLANGIAEWNGSTWSTFGSGLNGYYHSVRALAVSGNNLYVGGDFTTAGGVTVNAIAKWDGSTWSALGSGINGSSSTVYALAVSGNNLYVGGFFATAGGVPAQNIAKWDGSGWSALGSGIRISYTPYGSVLALAVSGTELYTGGSFNQAGGVTADHIAKWDGSAWSALGEGMNDAVLALAVSGTNLYVSGIFISAGGVSANCIAKWDGSVWSALSSGMNESNSLDAAEVVALAVSGTNLYAGGFFDTAGGVSAHCIAKWDGSGWSALGSGMGIGYTPYCGVLALAASGNDLYAGGLFDTAGGVSATNIAKWNGSGWSALGSGVGGVWYSVSTLAIIGTNLYAGGGFTNAGGLSANYIARWNGSTWSALGSGMNSGVLTLAVIGTNLYAGGDFTTAGGVPANRIAKWDGSTWSALGSGMNNTVSALAVIGPDLYAGGNFTTAGGILANHIAKWDGNSWSALGSGTDGNVSALATDGSGHLFVGGSFYLAGTNVSPYIAQANLGSAPTILTPPQSQTAESGSLVEFIPDIEGYPAMTCLLFLNGTNLISCGTDACLVLTNVDFSRSGTYTVVITNVFGAVTSAPFALNIITPVEKRLVPGVKVMGETGSLLNVEYADALGSPANWLPLDTVNLTNPPQYCFDVFVPLPSQRFYRAWQSGSPSIAPSLSLPGMVPAITLTGNIGDVLRLDCINAIGPTDAWVTLDTVTLTNTSQLYFDTSSIGQPRRLYRIVPVP